MSITLPPVVESPVVESVINVDPPSKESELDKKSSMATNVQVAERGSNTEPDPDDFPDGGWRAWGVAFGGACVTMATFGYVNSWGIFQSYYQDVILPTTSPSTIAWIGSIQYALVFLPGIVMGRLFDQGLFHVPFGISSASLVVAALITAQCRQYWQFLLVQGLLTGTACGCCFGVTLGAVAHWFKRKRNLAFGCVASGSSIGGTVFPLIARSLLPKVGFQWTIRICAFVILGCLTISNLLLKPRLPPRKLKGKIVDLHHLKHPAFASYTAAGFVTFLGMYTVLTYVGTAARSYGSSESEAFSLVSIANAASLVGRLSTGFLADIFGCLNLLIPCTFVAAILTIAWPFATMYSTIVPVVVLYGVASGAFVGMLGSPVIQMGETQAAGERSGLLLSIVAIGALLGPPISGAIHDADGGFHATGYYAGSAIIVGVILMMLVKYFLTGSVLRGRV